MSRYGNRNISSLYMTSERFDWNREFRYEIRKAENGYKLAEKRLRTMKDGGRKDLQDAEEVVLDAKQRLEELEERLTQWTKDSKAEVVSSNHLLLQAKSTSSESFVTINMGETYFLDDGKCAVAIQSCFFTFKPHRDRLKYLKLEYTFSHRGGQPLNIVDFRPWRSIGPDTAVSVAQEVDLHVTEPHTGFGGNAKQTKEFVQKERMVILGQDFSGGQGGSETKVIWVLSENPADKKGIPPGFQGVVVLDSTTPFTIGIKVFADIPGSVKDWVIFSHKGAEGEYNIDPKEWKVDDSPYKKVADFQEWDGSIPNACVRWAGIV